MKIPCSKIHKSSFLYAHADVGEKSDELKMEIEKNPSKKGKNRNRVELHSQPNCKLKKIFYG